MSNEISITEQIVQSRGELSDMLGSISNIANESAYIMMADILKRAKLIYKILDDREKEITRPALASIASTRDLFSEPKELAARVEINAKGKMAEYQSRLAEIAREAQRIAEQKAEAERQRLAALAAKAVARGDEKKAEAFVERERAVVAPVLAANKPKVSGVSMRTKYVGTIINPMLLPRKYLIPNERMIRAEVDALGSECNIPGVSVTATQIIASTRG